VIGVTVEPFRASPAPGTHFAALADAARTGGALGVVLSRCDPDRPVPPHTHTGEDETVVVQAGGCVLTIAGTEFPAAAGDLVFARAAGRTASARSAAPPGCLPC
jgi:quercetin dioxygenase-like cupin family protein